MSTSRIALSVLIKVPKCIRRATDIYIRSGTVVIPIPSLAGSSLHRIRSFASSPIAHAASLVPTEVPKVIASVFSSPNPDELQAQELDVDMIPPEDVRIELTDRAAEQLKSIATRERHPEAGLRIAVESGGCHGYQYTMELASERTPEDYHFTHPAISPSNIYIDAVSLGLLNGSTIDFATELIGSSFRVANNPQAKGGCGCGVSWEMKD